MSNKNCGDLIGEACLAWLAFVVGVFCLKALALFALVAFIAISNFN